MSKEVNQDFEKEEEELITEPEVKDELSKVSSSKKKNIAIIVVVVLLALYFLVFVVFKDDDKKQKEEKVELSEDTEVVLPVTDDTYYQDSYNINTTTAPVLIEPDEPPTVELPSESKNTSTKEDTKAETVALPTADPAPTSSVGTTQLELPNSKSSSSRVNSDKQARRDAKIKSSMILISNDISTTAAKSGIGMADESSGAFKKRSDLTYILSRGKIIDAVLESAINTDFGGEIRAIISRDVYGEDGNLKLIPRGSKIFGSYTTAVDDKGYGRVAVVWNKVYLASGYTIDFDAHAVDNLGRKGIQGRLDNKYKEEIANAVVISAFNIAFARMLDKVVEPVLTSDQNKKSQDTIDGIRNSTFAIYSDPNKTTNQKISDICTTTKNYIEDKSSSAYKTIDTECANAQSSTNSATEEQKLSALMAAMNKVVDDLSSMSTGGSSKTKAQEAAEDAFHDVTDVIKDIVEDQNFDPTITIDQGTTFRIYVNKDYKFPKEVINSRRLGR